jgi:riboflavin kinase/FMN adenylyltransferase
MQTALQAPSISRRRAPAARAVAIGTFDGVHRGHQAVIQGLAEGRLVPTVVTFDPHPRTVFGVDVPMITTIERRIELLHAAGAREVVVVEFSPATARQSAEEWIESTLIPLGTRAVAVGSDFRFGRGRAGDVSTLRLHGLDVQEITLVPGISSTEIRRLVALGRLAEAVELLGRPFAVSTVVEMVARTDNRGATLFLAPVLSAAVLPPDGMYEARIDGIPGIATLANSCLQFVASHAATGWRRDRHCELELTAGYSPNGWTSRLATG